MNDKLLSLCLSPSLSLHLPLSPSVLYSITRVVLIQFLNNTLKATNTTILLPDTRTGLSTRVKPASEESAKVAQLLNFEHDLAYRKIHCEVLLLVQITAFTAFSLNTNAVSKKNGYTWRFLLLSHNSVSFLLHFWESTKTCFPQGSRWHISAHQPSQQYSYFMLCTAHMTK